MRLCTYGRRSLVKSGSRRRRGSTTPGYADVMQALSELGIDVAAATFPSNVRRDSRQQMTSAFSDVAADTGGLVKQLRLGMMRCLSKHFFD
jgi:hypothetical protein